MGHTKIESRVRNLDIETDDAIEISETIDVRSARAELSRSARTPFVEEGSRMSFQCDARELNFIGQHSGRYRSLPASNGSRDMWL